MSKYNIETLTNYCIKNLVELTKKYQIVKRETKIEGKCIISDCNNTFNKSFRALIDTDAICNCCAIKKGIKKSKESFKLKYGVEHPLQNKEIMDKLKKTNMAKYGHENQFQSKKIKEKMKQTNMAKYGHENVMQNKEIKEKSKKTNMEKYGFEYTLQVEEFKEKGRLSNLELYNVENAMQRQEVKEKFKKTNMEKYGVEHPLQSEIIKDKYKETSILNYGVPHPMQNKEVMSRNTASQYKSKIYILPSGKEISVQGYEPFALNDIFKVYTEEEVITGTENVPELWYSIDNKKHRHYVDIYIPKDNLCIEIKSVWTLESKKDNIFIKKQSAKEAGYNYEIWVYDKSGNKIEIK